MENTLYYGDNLKVLKQLSTRDPFIDLIYIDPPFNSKRNYNILYEDLIRSKENGDKATALKEAFVDTWSNVSLGAELEEMKGFESLKLHRFLINNREIFSDSQMSYLTMMSHRIYYMHKVLKDTGSFYLHCDPTMSHYLKIVCDIIFGNNNFRNEIVWCYRTGGSSSKQWSKKHDIILFYTKSDILTFNLQKEKAYTKSKSRKPGIINYGSGKAEFFQDDQGVYNLVNARDIWDIPYINSQAKERLGYPTQKPEALLERIIKASSNEGDLVADFFCGCGTTIAVAQKLNRKWLGLDISHLAIALIEDKRLKPIKANYVVKGFPVDLAQAQKLAKEKHFEFEKWIVEYVFKGHSTKRTGDGGYDGHIAFNDGNSKKICIMEIKGGGCNIKNLREFTNVIDTQKADMGIFICFLEHVTSGMQKHCDYKGNIKMENHLFTNTIPKLSIITVEDIISKSLPSWSNQFLQNITY